MLEIEREKKGNKKSWMDRRTKCVTEQMFIVAESENKKDMINKNITKPFNTYKKYFFLYVFCSLTDRTRKKLVE